MEKIHDIRLLLAVLAPLVGAGLVMLNGKRPNVRETCSFAAAVVLFALTASMIPLVLQGKMLHLTVFQLIPSDAKSTGLSFALRADALSMVFALSASFLWILTAFYSAG